MSEESKPIAPGGASPISLCIDCGRPQQGSDGCAAHERNADAYGWTEDCYRATIERLRARLSTAEKERDSAYGERNQCVALIAEMARRLGWLAGVAQHVDKPGETWDPDWRTIVFVDLPTGQVSWHFHDNEENLWAGLPPYPLPWDGHDTPEKYRRVRAALSRSPATDAPEAPKASEIASDSSALEKALVALRELRGFFSFRPPHIDVVHQVTYSWEVGPGDRLAAALSAADAALGGAHVDGPKAPQEESK